MNLLPFPVFQIFKVTKGAPHVLLEMTYNKEDIRKEVEDTVLGLAHRGIRSLAVSCTDHNAQDRWVFMGIMTFLDPPRPDTMITIKRCAEFGVTTKMITGDHKVSPTKRSDLGGSPRDYFLLTPLGRVDTVVI